MALRDSNTFVEPTAATTLATARTQFNNALRSLLTNFQGSSQPSLSGANITRSGSAVAPEDGMLYRHSNANVSALYIADSVHTKSATLDNFTRVGIGVRVENGIEALMSNVNHYEIGELAATPSAAPSIAANGRLYLNVANNNNDGDFVDVGIPPTNGSVSNTMVQLHLTAGGAATSKTTGITGDRLNFAFDSAKGLAGQNAQIRVSAIASNPTAIAFGTINSANTALVHYGGASSAQALAGKDGLNVLSQDGKTYGNVAAGSVSVATITKIGSTATSAQEVAILTPVGTIKMYGHTSAPAGYLACDGTAVSRSTYAALFALIGENFGNGDGSSTFNLPNFQDRMAAGLGTNVNRTKTSTTIGGSGQLTTAGGSLSLSPTTTSVATASKDIASTISAHTGISGTFPSSTVTMAYQGVLFIIKT